MTNYKTSILLNNCVYVNIICPKPKIIVHVPTKMLKKPNIDILHDSNCIVLLYLFIILLLLYIFFIN